MSNLSDADLAARLDRMEALLTSLTDRVADLERRFDWAAEGWEEEDLAKAQAEATAKAGAAATAKVEASAKVPARAGQTGEWREPAMPPIAAPLPAGAPAGPPAPARDWEQLIGGRWALWVGALAIFLAVGFFLANAWAQIPPAARVGSGLALACGLLGGGAWFRRRAQPWFAEGLAGAGLALLYLVIWAARNSYGLIALETTFAAFIGVTALGAFLAVRHDGKSQMALATAGGFLTPLMLGGGGTAGPGLVFYVDMLDAGLLAISLFRRWPGVAWACLVGTVGMWLVASPQGPVWTMFAAQALAFALFGATAVGYSLRKGEQTAPHDVALLVTAATVFAPAAYVGIADQLGDWRMAFPLGLALLFAAMAVAARRFIPANQPFQAGNMTLAILFATLALPTRFEEGHLALAWTIEAVLLAGLAIRFDDAIYRAHARVVGVAAAIAAGVWCFGELPPGAPPIVNARALPVFTAVVGALALAAWARRLGKPLGNGVVLTLLVATPCWAGIDAQGAVAAWGLAEVGAVRLAMGGTAIAAALYHALGTWWGQANLRQGALGLWLFTALWLVVVDPTGDVNDLRLAALMAVLSAAGAILFMRRGESAALATASPNEALALRAVPLGMALMGVWGLSLEVQALVRGWAMPGWERQAQLGISLVWIVSGVAYLVGGAARAARPFRLLGLGLLAASVCKVFLFDLAYLDTPYRVAALGGLGAALMGISWLYGRFGKEAPPVAGS